MRAPAPVHFKVNTLSVCCIDFTVMYVVFYSSCGVSEW